MIPTQTLRVLAARASTIEERLAPPFVPAATASSAAQIDARIARWAALGAKGDRDRLRRSLSWRGIDLDRVAPALGEATLCPDAPLPDWTGRFAILLEAALSVHREAAVDLPETVDHAAVMAPLAASAAAELDRMLPAPWRGGIADSVLARLQRSLLVRLTRIASAVLASAHYAFAYRDSRAGGAARTRPQRFADSMLRPPIPEFLVEYPVLARLLTLACDNWRDASIELLRRLADDRRALAECFNDGVDPGALVDIEVGDADVHDGHREVVTLVFAADFRVVYKPRSLALDAAVQALVGWLNGRGLSPPLRTPTVLCRDGYGWAEFIAHRPANGADELSLFYRRAGALACLAYAMGATDLHYGNVIAHGAYPIAVDLETMLKALPRPQALPTPPDHPAAVMASGDRSVLQSLLLPIAQPLPGGLYGDLSALGVDVESGADDPEPACLPVRETPIEELLADHAGAIEAGFVAAYRLILRERTALLADCGPLAAFAACPIRVVLRDTALYFRILRYSIDPAVLRDGADREIALERLNHVIAIADNAPSFVSMVTRERAALAQLDVPRFVVMTNQTDLRDAAGLVAGDIMERTPLAEARRRLAGMDEADLRRQCDDIRLALSARIVGRRRAGAGDIPAPPASVRRSPDPAALIAAAQRLAGDLLCEAEAPDGPPRWRGLIYVSGGRRFTVGDAGGGFADGGLGIAVLFAAVFRITRDERWRDAALALARSYLAQRADRDDLYHGHIAGGIAAGLGGISYGAALLAELTEAPELAQLGRAATARFAGRAVDEERGMSLADGLAGTLIGIAALRRRVPDAALAAAEARAIVRLNEAQSLASPGLLSGQAGARLALHRLGGTDKRAPERVVSDIGIDWAEGTLGVAVAELAADPTASAGLATIDELAAAAPAADDDFACGSAGEADALLWVAQRTARRDLGASATRRIAATVKRVQSGAPRLLGGRLAAGLRLPGLLHGTAGIGYVLLRLAAPARLPALAAFETTTMRDPR